MKIVLLNQFFWPDTVATSQMLTEVARSLGEEHHVTVLCGGQSSLNLPSQSNSGLNVNILRIRNCEFGHSWVARVASYLSYLTGVIWHCLLLRKVDCYVTLTTPPILSVIAGGFAVTRRTRHVIWEMDVYPDIATDIGYLNKGGIIERISGTLIDWSRKRASAIVVLGEDMKDRLTSRGIPKSAITVVENWADGTAIRPLPLPPGPLVIHYSGNLGLAHEIDTITSAVRRLANHPMFRFIFAGGGARRRQLEAHCHDRGITNVEFRPYCTNAELGHSLGEGHLGLVTQIPETLGSIVPSKIYGIMAAGRPILYIGPAGSTPARHIEAYDCGWRIQPGDVDGLTSLLYHLADNRNLLAEAGERGRLAFEQNFDRPIGVARILPIVLGTKLSEAAVLDSIFSEARN